MGHISFVGKFDGTMFAAGAPKLVPGLTLDIMAKHSLDFWLTSEDLPRSKQPRVPGSRRQHRAVVHTEQPGRPSTPDRKTQGPDAACRLPGAILSR